MVTVLSRKEEFLLEEHNKDMEESLRFDYHCSNSSCDYRTHTNDSTGEEAYEQLIADGGFDRSKKTCCPKCKQDSVVFLV